MREYDVRFNGADAPVEFSTDSFREAIETAQRLAEALPERWASYGYRVEHRDGTIEGVFAAARPDLDDDF